jgi:ABC-type sugar transport system ATPase subunit
MLLEMKDITKRFAGGVVLHGVDFELAAGEIHALIGHNGAGKSTLMKVLSGLYPDHGGDIIVDGKPAALATPADAQAKGVATIYQDFALVPEFTVAENIALGREPRLAYGLVDHAALRERSAREAADVGIDLPMDTPVQKLGVATQQLTEVVRALSKNARILIMDEPTARLAPKERSQLFDIMRRMARSGMGIIYISHFLDEVIDVADRITVLRDGRVAEHGPADRFTVDSLARLLVGDAGNETRETARTAQPADRRVRLKFRDFGVSGRRAFSLDIDAGEIFGLAGLIGSGRSRLARAIIGDVVSSGSITLDDELLVRLDPVNAARLGIVLVPEDRKVNGLVQTGSIQANIELSALAPLLSRFGIVRRKLRNSTVADAVRRFRVMPAEPDRNVATLSGGNAQKVLLARAAVARPRLLVLDQPTAGVDIGAKAELHRQIRELAATGTVVILISDDLDELLTLSDRIGIVQQGSVVDAVSSSGLDRARLLSAISRSG